MWKLSTKDHKATAFGGGGDDDEAKEVWVTSVSLRFGPLSIKVVYDTLPPKSNALSSHLGTNLRTFMTFLGALILCSWLRGPSTTPSGSGMFRKVGAILNRVPSILRSRCCLFALGTCLKKITDHTHYVQGVAWDPSGKFLVSQSSDRYPRYCYLFFIFITFT